MRAVASCLGFVLFALPAPVPAVEAIVVTPTNGLARFDTSTPNVVSLTSISGIGIGDVVVGMDVRPADRQVYLLTRNGSGAGRLYRLNPATGVAVLIGTLAPDPTDLTAPYTGLNGTAFGVDFNPVPDRLRVVSDGGQNLRINPGTVAVTTDADLNPGVPRVAASAYTNSFAGSTLTTLYGIDVASDSLVIQNPPNNGTITTVGTGLGVGDIADNAVFDIADAPALNSAFAVLTFNDTARVYTVNLATGTAAVIGELGGNPGVRGFAILDPGVVFKDGFE